MKIALHVITAAGYGYPMEWEASGEVPSGHLMSFRKSIHITLDNLVTLAAIPRWLPSRQIRTAAEACEELGKYMRGLIDLGKQRKQPGNSRNANNILQALVQHSGESSGNEKSRVLTDDEIVGNAFIFLLAGHETT